MVTRLDILLSERGKRRTDLETLIRQRYLDLALHIPGGCDLEPQALLAALAWQESTFGLHGGQSRVERAYCRGGTYYDGSSEVRDLWACYGSCAAASWSSWQILYVAAFELGFDLPPWRLFDDHIAFEWVIRYLDKRVLSKGATTVEDFADAYNSGTHRDSIVPVDYIKSFAQHYARCVALLQAGQPVGP